ncbi:nucleotide sugar dehydrogenase [Mangrovivirga cuniculi]|uniref:Vi polysaccharide biosynthesis protein VipA/TviB n=1 Tax=Mangrovivirga cuniculi TaxID=2715131 RepID=A0A4D7JLL9_9BACT|nr:nucleotide sugar dehydrogenase [Mangrovivirga cuniculi]QCK13452.1 Vi polysaccharide biosynthesis protein VipA/TviB [Mangrovivirga cuniculi]
MDKIGIIGLGYVGLPLAVEFGKKVNTLGFDINHKRIEELQKGKDRTLEVDPDELKEAEHLVYSSNLEDLASCNIYIVTVPTPIDNYKKPDLRPLIGASTTIGKVLKKGDIVIYESTVYPGCTEEDCVPVLEKISGLKYNEDFFCGYSPERINPGDKQHRLPTIKKVTSGSTPEIAEKVDNLYKSIITAGTHKASSIKVAEAAKVIENAQRDINIAFVNELAVVFDKMDIDTTEVLEAAGTKWNFLPFRPGLVGGHCIGVDPYYLTHKAESLGHHPEVILSGRRINDQMGLFIASKVIKLMTQMDNPIKNADILVMGITFKENCPDIRNSKVIDVIRELQSFGANVEVYDPLADPEEVQEEYGLTLIEKPSKKYNAIVMAVAHNEFESLDWSEIKNGNTAVYDVKAKLDKSTITARL